MIRVGPEIEPLVELLCRRYPTARHSTVVELLRLGGVRHPAAANRRVRELVDAGLLSRHHALVRPLLRLEKPLYAARGPFDYGRAEALAWQLEKRWTRDPLERARVYTPTARLLGVFGGVVKPRVGKYAQLSHDLQCAQLFTHYLRTDPAFARTLVSEHGQSGPKSAKDPRPDFLAVDSAGRAHLALDVGGVYDARRLRRLFADCERRGLALELW